MSITAIHIARPYARALLELAEEAKTLPETVAAMQALAEALNTPAWRAVISNPTLRPADFNALTKALAAVVPAAVIGLLQTLYRARRLAFWPHVAASFARLAKQALGQVAVDVSIAHKPSADITAMLTRYLTMALGGTPTIAWHENPSLLAGFIAKTDSVIIDASLQNRLNRLRHSLTVAPLPA